MSHTVTGRLNKDARLFDANGAQGFGFQLGVKYKNPKTKEEGWTNYNVTVFAKQPGQIEFYRKVLISGSVVSITSDKLMIEEYQGNNGLSISLQMINARVVYAYAGDNRADNTQASAAQHQQNSYEQLTQSQQAQVPQSQAPGSIDNFDDDIPF